MRQIKKNLKLILVAVVIAMVGIGAWLYNARNTAPSAEAAPWWPLARRA